MRGGERFGRQWPWGKVDEVAPKGTGPLCPGNYQRVLVVLWAPGCFCLQEIFTITFYGKKATLPSHTLFMFVFKHSFRTNNHPKWFKTTVFFCSIDHLGTMHSHLAIVWAVAALAVACAAAETAPNDTEVKVEAVTNATVLQKQLIDHGRRKLIRKFGNK